MDRTAVHTPGPEAVVAFEGNTRDRDDDVVELDAGHQLGLFLGASNRGHEVRAVLHLARADPTRRSTPGADHVDAALLVGHTHDALDRMRADVEPCEDLVVRHDLQVPLKSA
jgi:hypothetical protein